MTITTTSTDKPNASHDVSHEVMSRLAAQVLQMGQQMTFEQMLQQPEEEDYNYDDVELDDDDEESGQ